MNLRGRLRSAGPLLGLVAVWLLFALWRGETFATWQNQELMLLQTVVIGTAAVGATWVIVAGGIDLSVGSNIALSVMVGAFALRSGYGVAAAAAATVATGALVGWLIGALVVGDGVRAVLALLAGATSVRLNTAVGVGHGKALLVGALIAIAAWRATRRVGRRLSLPLSPFIVTLGLWGALRGLAKGLGDNQPIYFPNDAPALTGLMQSAGPLPPGVWVMLSVAAVAAFALRRSVFGRHVTALGSSRETARLCGVDVAAVERRVFVVAGCAAGIAAVLQLSFLSMGDPTTAQGYELKVIAAAVIGGASLSGGEGSIVGTLLGALIMTVVDNGCTKLQLDNWVQDVVTGALIVAAVALDRWRQRAV